MTLAPLLTPEQFAAGTNGKISQSDPRLLPLLAGASTGIRRYCRWHVTPVLSNDVMVLDGHGGDLLALRTMRLTEVTSVSEHGRFLIDGQDFEWSENGELRRLTGRWTSRYRAITVTCSHGFDDAADLVQVVQQVVANALASPMGATREQAGALSVTWSTTAPGVSGGISLLARDLATLDLYRLGRGA